MRACGGLQLETETGGQGLGKMGMAVCYEEMNPLVFGLYLSTPLHPTTGNIDGAGKQRERPRRKNVASIPIVRGDCAILPL